MQNKNVVEYDLKSLLDLHKDNIFASLNCHALGTIQSFDPVKQIAEVTVNYKRTVNDKPADYPLIIDCPVIILGGGKGSIRFPISQGDDCLILFNDRDIDNWFSGQNAMPVNSPRMHSFADSLAIVGPRSLKSALTDYDATKTELYHGSANKLSLSDTKAELIKGTSRVSVGDKINLSNASANLNALLQELITDVKNLVTACANITVAAGFLATPPGGGAVTGVSGKPVNASDINAASSQLTATANKIAGLLE